MHQHVFFCLTVISMLCHLNCLWNLTYGRYALLFLGASFHACDYSGQHLVIMEGDYAIFNGILVHVCDVTLLIRLWHVQVSPTLLALHAVTE